MANTIWLTPKEAAAHAKCSRITLRRAVKTGQLPAFRINERLVRFRQADLDAWLTPIDKAVR